MDMPQRFKIPQRFIPHHSCLQKFDSWAQNHFFLVVFLDFDLHVLIVDHRQVHFLHVLLEDRFLKGSRKALLIFNDF